MPSLEFKGESPPMGRAFQILLEPNKNKENTEILQRCTVRQAHLRDLGEIIFIADGGRSDDINRAMELGRIQTQDIWFQSLVPPTIAS